MADKDIGFNYEGELRKLQGVGNEEKIKIQMYAMNRGKEGKGQGVSIREKKWEERKNARKNRWEKYPKRKESIPAGRGSKKSKQELTNEDIWDELSDIYKVIDQMMDDIRNLHQTCTNLGGYMTRYEYFWLQGQEATKDNVKDDEA